MLTRFADAFDKNNAEGICREAFRAEGASERDRSGTTREAR